MVLANKLNIASQVELNRVEEKLSKQKAKQLFESALTDQINDHELYMKGIDVSYYYESYSEYRVEDL